MVSGQSFPVRPLLMGGEAPFSGVSMMPRHGRKQTGFHVHTCIASFASRALRRRSTKGGTVCSHTRIFSRCATSHDPNQSLG